MFTIVRKEELAQETYLFEIEAPRLAKSALPGQFLIVKMTEKSERIPLTISDYDVEKGTIVIDNSSAWRMNEDSFSLVAA